MNVLWLKHLEIEFPWLVQTLLLLWYVGQVQYLWIMFLPRQIVFLAQELQVVNEPQCTSAQVQSTLHWHSWVRIIPLRSIIVLDYALLWFWSQVNIPKHVVQLLRTPLYRSLYVKSFLHKQHYGFLQYATCLHHLEYSTMYGILKVPLKESVSMK